MPCMCLMYFSPGAFPCNFFSLPQQDMDKLVYKMSPLHDNMRLLHEAAKRLPENSREQNLALELIEFLELLITLKISAEPDIQEH